MVHGITGIQTTTGGVAFLTFSGVLATFRSIPCDASGGLASVTTALGAGHRVGKRADLYSGTPLFCTEEPACPTSRPERTGPDSVQLWRADLGGGIVLRIVWGSGGVVAHPAVSPSAVAPRSDFRSSRCCRRQPSKSRTWLIIAAVIILGLAAGGVAVAESQSSTASQERPSSSDPHEWD